MEKSISSGCCAKLTFCLIFAVLCLVDTVTCVDYKPCKLKIGYKIMNIPEEIAASLEKGANAVSNVFSTISSYIKGQCSGANRLGRNGLQDVDVAWGNIEHLFFAEKNYDVGDVKDKSSTERETQNTEDKPKQEKLETDCNEMDQPKAQKELERLVCEVQELSLIHI